MRVIFVSREGYDLSGARIRCYGFAREVRKHGIETRVFSFADVLGARYGENELQMPLKEKIRLIWLAFERLIKENRGSIFFIQRFNYHTFAPLLVSFFKKNKIVFDMDDWDMREEPKYYFGFYPSSKAEYLTRQIARKSSTCIAASKYLAGYLSKFNKKVHYVPTGVDIKQFDFNLNRNNNGKVVFSWVGTIYHKEMFENLRFIISCFSDLSKKYPYAKLEIVGGGRYIKNIKDIVCAVSLKDKVVVRGWINPDQMPAYLAGIDVGLLPLIQHTKFNSAKSPTKLFEYMAMGKPVIASNLGEAMHVIKEGHNGFLAHNRQEFIERMEDLILSRKLREDMGINGRKTVEEKYSLSYLGDKIAEILQKI